MKLANSSKVLLGAVLCAVSISTSAESQEDQNKLALANNSFAFDLFKQITKEQPGKNIFISPYSVSAVLEMIGNGAAGQTRAEMERVLHLNGLTWEALNAAYKEIDQSIKLETNVVLNIANSIWYQKRFQLKPEFAAVNQNFYGAKLDALDFGDPKSVEIINSWAKESTQGRIPSILQPPIDNLTMLMLANAVYFKGAWAAKFDRQLTTNRTFTLLDGRKKQTPMMQQSGEYDYQYGAGFQAIRLSYRGSRLGFYVILPDAHSSLDRLLTGLDGRRWQITMRPFRENKGTIVLPRFKINYDATLTNALQALGMRLSFDPDQADFSAMSAMPLWVGTVKQASFVEVNEEGTEAAAVTLGSMLGGAAPKPPRPFEMVVDRPFLFLIEDHRTESILFMGVVFEPMDAAVQ